MQISNAKEVILHHEAEWTRILSDENDKQSLLRYGMVLLTIAYVLLFALSLVVGMAVTSILPFSALHIITSVAIQFALSIASLYFVPMILASLAPSFGGQNNPMNALKLFVFASTPAWLGMAVSMIPLLGWLAAIAGGIFAIYLFWHHVAEAMSIPAEKKVGYVVVAVIVLVVINIVIGMIGAGIANLVSPYSYHIGY